MFWKTVSESKFLLPPNHAMSLMMSVVVRLLVAHCA